MSKMHGLTAAAQQAGRIGGVAAVATIHMVPPAPPAQPVQAPWPSQNAMCSAQNDSTVDLPASVNGAPGSPCRQSRRLLRCWHAELR